MSAGKKEKRDREHTFDEIDEILSRIEYPGEDENALERQVTRADMPRRVMDEIRAFTRADAGFPYTHARGEEVPGPVLGAAAFKWAAATLLNILLLILFESRPMLLTSAVGPGDFYSQMMFLFLGISVSVSLGGFIISVDLEWMRKLLPSLLLRRSR